MKKIFLLSLFTLTIHAFVFSQGVPNNGYENWITSGSYSNPQYWDSPNSVTTAIPFIGAAVVSKNSGGHSGSWSAKLESKNFILYTVPGIMTLGTLGIDLANFNFSLTGGVPYTQRPDVFKGYYKFSPQGGDTCAFLAIFYKQNGSGTRDTIGIAYFLQDTAKTNWTLFEAPVLWYTNDNPDSMNIVVSSAASFSATAGTTLYVDDLSFDFYTAVPEVKPNDPISIQYNRVAKNINISLDLEGEQKVSARVINITGQTVSNLETTVYGEKSLKISLEDQPKGLYVVEVRSGEQKLVKKIVVN